MLAEAPLVYEAGSWVIDTVQREVRVRGIPVAIGSRAFEIIERLVESAGELVATDELKALVWPGINVEQNTLRVHIAAIRRALGPDRTMLKTVSRRGYRLLGDWHVRSSNVSRAIFDGNREPAAVGPSSNLPAYVANLIGRSGTSNLLRDLLSAYRIVTLTGPGGIGKTALAIEVARGLAADFADGIWLVELAASADPGLVASAVAAVLGLRLSGETISPDAVARAIGTKTLLLVLDNCEHVLESVANLAETVVRSCPNVTVLTTSREALQVAGECVYRVPPLDIPESDREETGRLLGRSAVELFVARAQALDADFTPRADNLPSIAAICRHLDGIPLAIEFAAARTVSLGAQQVAAGLSDRFELLSSRRRTALPRHQTLRATLDWSYALLSQQEQALLRQLAIFAGGFSLDAVTIVTLAGGANPGTVAVSIASLVAKSWVIFEGTTAPNRWRLLETIRAYALEKLTDSGEHLIAARRHAEYFRDLLVPAVISSMVSLSADHVARCSRELNNVRAALDWSFSANGDVAIGTVLTAAFAPIWTQMSLVGECRDRVERMLAPQRRDLNLSATLERQMCIAYAIALTATLGPVERNRGAIRRARQLGEGVDDAELQVHLCYCQWASAMCSGDYQTSLVTAQQLNELAQHGADNATKLLGDHYLGTSLLYAGGLPAARTCLQSVVDDYIAPRDGRHATLFHLEQQPVARSKLARVLLLLGNMDRSLEEAQLSFEASQASDARSTLCWVLLDGLCPIALMTGDLAAAERAVGAMSDYATRTDAALWNNIAMCWRGKLLIERREFAQGVVLMRRALEVCEQTGWQLCHAQFLGYLAEGLAGLGQLDEAHDTIERAIARAEQFGEGWCKAELIRFKGELLLQGRSDPFTAMAEECFWRANEVAKEQGALFWELRIALSLARLRAKQGRHDEVRQVLEPVYDRFTEGFGTADLRAARGMLDNLPR